MINEHRTVLLDYIKNTMMKLDERHALESKEMSIRHDVERRKTENEMMRFADSIPDVAQPALFVVPVAPVDDRPFPNEQHLYVGSRIHALRGQGERPRRWRGDVVEYWYPKGGKLKHSGTAIGTVEHKDGSFVGCWLTVYEAKSLYRGQN